MSGESSLGYIMAKAINDAKEMRQKHLLEFEAAVEDLQDLLDAGNGTIRSLKNKLGVVKVTYDDVMQNL